MTGNTTKLCSSVNMTGFCILKALNINIHPPKAPLIIEVLWIPPLFNWLKINTDGAYIKNSAKAACGGIVRDAMGACIGCFAQDIPNCTSAFSKLHFCFLC